MSRLGENDSLAAQRVKGSKQTIWGTAGDEQDEQASMQRGEPRVNALTLERPTCFRQDDVQIL